MSADISTPTPPPALQYLFSHPNEYGVALVIFTRYPELAEVDFDRRLATFPSWENWYTFRFLIGEVVLPEDTPHSA